MDNTFKPNKSKTTSLIPLRWPGTSLIRREVRVYYLQRGEVSSAVIVDIQSRKLCTSSKGFYFSRPGELAMDDLPLHNLKAFFCNDT